MLHIPLVLQLLRYNLVEENTKLDVWLWLLRWPGKENLFFKQKKLCYNKFLFQNVPLGRIYTAHLQLVDQLNHNFVRNIVQSMNSRIHRHVLIFEMMIYWMIGLIESRFHRLLCTFWKRLQCILLDYHLLMSEKRKKRMRQTTDKCLTTAWSVEEMRTGRAKTDRTATKTATDEEKTASCRIRRANCISSCSLPFIFWKSMLDCLDFSVGK